MSFLTRKFSNWNVCFFRGFWALCLQNACSLRKMQRINKWGADKAPYFFALCMSIWESTIRSSNSCIVAQNILHVLQGFPLGLWILRYLSGMYLALTFLVLSAKLKENYFEGCGKSLACHNICPIGLPVEELIVRSNSVAIWGRQWVSKRWLKKTWLTYIYGFTKNRDISFVSVW